MVVDSCALLRLATIDCAVYQPIGQLGNYKLEVPVNALHRASPRKQIDSVRTALGNPKSNELGDEPLFAKARTALRAAAAPHPPETMHPFFRSLQSVQVPDADLEAYKNALTYAMLALISDIKCNKRCRQWYRAISAPVLLNVKQLVIAGTKVDSEHFSGVHQPRTRAFRPLPPGNGLQINDTRNWEQFYYCDVTHESQSMLCVIVGDALDTSI